MENTPYSRFVSLVLFDQATTALKKKKKLLKSQVDELAAQQVLVQASLDRDRALLKSERKAKDEVELELASLAQDLSKKEQRLEKTSGAKEYLALQHECEALVAQRDGLETRLLDIWKNIEELEPKVAGIEKEYAERLKKIDDAVAQLNHEIELINEQLPVRDTVRVLKREGVLEAQLSLYESMREHFEDPAVAMEQGVCSGCGSIVARGDQGSVERHLIVACQQCRRLLLEGSFMRQFQEEPL